MNLKFDSVFYYVRDIERSIKFYSEVLGLQLESRDTVARFYLDDVLLELVPTDRPAELKGSGNARVTFEVQGVADAIRELREKGVSTGPTKSVENGVLATFKDPDGNELVLWEYSGTKLAF